MPSKNLNHRLSKTRQRSSLTFLALLPAILLACLFPLVVNAAQITLAWDPNLEETLAGYRVYYGTASGSYISSIDAGNVTSCVFTDLQNGSTYYFAVTALDTSGAESSYSNEVAATFDVNGTLVDTGASTVTETSTSSGGGGGGGGGGCFIATAAYGSYSEPHVLVLRKFRDAFLLTNGPGRAFVRWYYATSPPIAEYIRNNQLLKLGVRISLLPAVVFSYLCLTFGAVPALVIVVLFLALFVVSVAYRRVFFRERRITQ